MNKNHDCAHCAKKHLSQALVILEEILGGYQNTDHEIYCMGHLAEAASHLLSNPELSASIRDFRKKLFEQRAGVSVDDLAKIKEFCSKLNQKSVLSPTPQQPVLDSTVCVITPTGDRPATLKILKECLERQTIKPRAWVVVDDGVMESLSVIKDYPTLIYIRRDKQETGHTLRENMLLALRSHAGSNNIIMEDDDWYAPDYIETMLAGLKQNKLVGVRPYMYYSLASKSYLTRPTEKSMSVWANTAFRGEIVPEMLPIIEQTKDHSLDVNVWNALGNKYGYIVEKDHILHVGIKNAPGRAGTTGMHNRESLGTLDADYTYLTSVVGEYFANKYKNLLDTVDVVLPLSSNGSKFDNLEARMALRSIQTNFLNLGKIYVVCEELPAWMTNVVHVKRGDSSASGKDAVLIHKVLEACKIPELSQKFIFWSDDQVLTSPLSSADIVPVVASIPIDKMGNSKWNNRLKRTKELLESKGKPSHNWESHVPQLFDKTKFVEIMSSVDFDSDIGYGINTLYFNMLDTQPTVKQESVKVTLEGQKLCCGGIPKAIRGKPWIGYNDAGFQNGLSNWLKNNFPAPSKYENDIVMPIVESLPQAVMDNGPTSPTITFAMLFEKKELILKQFPDLKTHYDEIEAKKAANPQWREGNLVMYANPLMMGFMDSCVKSGISPYEFLGIS